MNMDELCVSMLGTVSINMGTTGSKQTIYTVPTGYKLWVYAVVCREPSADISAAVDMDFGGTAATDWAEQVSLAGLSATNKVVIITVPAQAAGPPILPSAKIIYPAATVFGVTITTGAAGKTCNMDLYGRLI